MKRLSFVVLLCALGSVYPSAQAQQYKVGFVNVSKVLEQAPQAEAARAKLEKEFAPRDGQLVSTQKDIRQLEDKLGRDGVVMSDAERDRIELDLRTRKRDLKRLQDEFREDLNLRRNQELATLQREVLDAIQALAKAENYDLIVSDGVIFASERVDISDQIIERLKRQGRGSGKR